jgi:hypothetical protein
MASSIGHTTSRPLGPHHSVDWVRFGKKEKKLASSRGFTANRVTIIGDSIVHRIAQMLYTSVQGYPGAYLRDLVGMCHQGIYDVTRFEAVVVMAGTNDFSSNYSQTQILAMVTAIINYIRAVNPSAQIAICGILPRPCDARHPRTFPKIQARFQLNTALNLHCQATGVAFFKTDKALKGKGPDNYLYHTDLLHLSDNGIHFLKKWLEGRIACLIGATSQTAN